MDACLQIAALKGIQAADEGSNFVFSPFTLATALSLIAESSRGETLRELLSFLGSRYLDHIRSASAELIKAIGTGDCDMILSPVNGAWIDRSMKINPSFMVAAVSFYSARIESADFNSQKINNNDILQDLIPDSAVDCSAKLILANALCFKDKWLEKFDSSMTEYDTFYLLNGSIVQAPYMKSTKGQFISSFEDFKVLRLPYMNMGDELEKKVAPPLARGLKLPYRIDEGNGIEKLSNFSLLLFLPNERDGLHDLIKRATFDPNFIREHVPCYTAEVGQFMVPKFKISFNFEASKELKHLGIKAMFNPLGANLSGFCLESHQLSVSSIYHKATIEVDENGLTEDAAATSVAPPPVANFVADHPFMFVVMEEMSKSILLLGHVVDPSIQ